MSLRPIPVLLYHRIEPVGSEMSSSFSTPLDLFRLHMEWLAERGYRSLTMAELASRIDGAPPFASSEVVITFDDGYASLDWAAAPALRACGLNATAFLITNRVDEGGYISWKRARCLADDGVMEFHSHSHSHQRWKLGAGTRETIAAEIRKSGEMLSANLDRPIDHFKYLAWPYGRTCDEWDEAADQVGMTTQFVVQRGAVTHRLRHNRLPRLMADGMSL
ncbi:MAG: polysaccharide deacetylase family protein, partial [Acidimicrobiia bacterium]|nr:polysaccharide deacetylase family protein [Acidimicrobiia bacterium]